MENVNRVNDPLASMMPPRFGGCTNQDNIKVTNGDEVMFGPGVYCGQIEVLGGALIEGAYRVFSSFRA